MVNHWLLRVGDGDHFIKSSNKLIWGIDGKTKHGKKFLKFSSSGDILWFIQSKTGGKILAVATYTYSNERILGPLLQLTATNEELGWTKQEGNWDTEVHYKDLYNLSSCELFTHIKSPMVIRTFNQEKCKVDLPIEYKYIVKYAGVGRNM